MKTMQKRLWVLMVGLALVASGCLKTRSQLRADDEDNPAPQEAQVRDVTPKADYLVDEMKAEITRMTGRIEDLERAQKQGKDEPAAKEEMKKLENRIVELEQAQASMLAELKKLQGTIPQKENPELFDKAKAEHKAGKCNDAVETLNEYLKAQKPKYAEEATFMRGDCYLTLKQYKKAILDFSKFQEKFTTSKKLPQALLKIGQSFEGMGMKDDAKGFYQELVEKFPKSPEAAKVKKKAK
ncbi:MAG: tetratricopeptide repeat protein [Bdellovibrionales bacterium]|nr:tetratricopeptide repeat protein [Bdellovibrionales bacterium]